MERRSKQAVRLCRFSWALETCERSNWCLKMVHAERLGHSEKRRFAVRGTTVVVAQKLVVPPIGYGPTAQSSGSRSPKKEATQA